ncbi:MAG TPA: PIN domain-containing protein [Ramlibacter sp.]|uniref:PIN domain-containing protein n=1 Tax=Ramlibacter sp. TaxID=1917967 RepID=UPI002C64F09F|nr:PIN domain-containing protein [Ramlibacter sp.]HVZ46904.1 PIN domain-containing protein [Ramlibacter sp.]
MRFFDTNVFVYSIDPSDPQKLRTSRRWLREAMQEETMVLSTQVLLEFFDVAVRKALVEPTRAMELLRAWASQHVVVPGVQAVLRAAELQQQHRLRIWDALIVAAALESGCTELVTEDLQHGMRIGDLQIVNPFVPDSLAKGSAVHEQAPAYATPAKRSRARRSR